MSKVFLRVGIDHGTSNSGIAVMEPAGPRVVRVDGADEVMPSVVYIYKGGRKVIGAAARKAIVHNRPGEGNGHAGYKTKIAQGDRYEFLAAGQSLTAPELGGLVIGQLLRAFREETQEEVQGAVITVPAKFEHSACEATREAGRLAGLKYSVLIQEPIAASMAYGFTAADRDARWMIFDLGGGTLDISLLYVKGGQMEVPEDGHAGNNDLGGRKFDREVMEFALGELRRRYALAGFRENNPAFAMEWDRLFMACETAKIELSTRLTSAVKIDGVLCKDEKGKEVEVDIPISRQQYEGMISALIQKAVYLSKTLLEKNRLTPRDLSRVILIGGPTKTPFVQTALSEGFGFDVRPTIDPMTAVALGAAVHAATVELPEEYHPKVTAPETLAASFVSIELAYERTPKESPCLVAGTVTGEIDFDGVTVEIKRTGWSSGDITVGADGRFECEVLPLDEGVAKESIFETIVRSKTGEVLTSVSEPKILFPYRAVAGRLANSLLIAERGNRTTTLLKKGAELPCEATGKFVTVKDLKKGSSEDVLDIPVLEGVTNLFGEENTAADLNVHIGTLRITGSHERLTTDLPSGSKLEITLRSDESRTVVCRAYSPLLEDEFEGRIAAETYVGVDAEQVTTRFEATKKTLGECRALDEDFPTPGVAEKLRDIEALKAVEEIATECERAQQGERDALYRAYRRVLELAGAVAILNEMQTPMRIRSRIQALKKIVKDQEVKDLNDIEQEFGRVGPDGAKPELARTEESLDDIEWRVRGRPYYTLIDDCIAHYNEKLMPAPFALLKEADDWTDELHKRGGAKTLTAEELARCESLDKKFWELFPNHREALDNYHKKKAEKWAEAEAGKPKGHVQRDTARNY